jgi:signal transduction histidine kinase
MASTLASGPERHHRLVGCPDPVDPRVGAPDSGVVKRALIVLTVGAYLTIVVGAAGVASVALGAAFVLVATIGFEWVQRRRRLALSSLYVVVQLVLGYAIFGLSGAGVGSTLLLVVLVSQSVLLLPLPAVAVVVCLIPLMHVGMPWRAGIREGLGTFAAMAFAAVVTELLRREQRARGEMGVAHRELQEYAVQAERLATAQERNRVARDIHDGLGHALTVVQMQIKAARAVLATDAARADTVLAKAQRQAEGALDEVRRSVAALRDPRPPLPLPDALRALADETSAAGVPTELEVSGPVRALVAEVEEALYRSAQEGLTNVRKHARATRVELILDYSLPTAVRLEVRDDGAGVADAAHAAGTPGFGLVGVCERAAHVGGQMSLESTPGHGSTLRVEVPG